MCGRKFKGRRGLRRHQCTCKIKKLLDVGSHDSTKSEERIDDPGECMNESSESQIDDDPTRTDADHPDILPGVHLPRNAKDWDEANTFFNIKFSDALYLPIESSGVTRVEGQPGQLTNKQGRHMGEDELTPPRFVKENSYICQCIDKILHSKCNFD